jgi:hypothetical protein
MAVLDAIQVVGMEGVGYKICFHAQGHAAKYINASPET